MVFMEVNPYKSAYLFEFFIIRWGLNDINVLGIVEILVKEGKSPDPIIWAGKKLNKITKPSPGAQFGRRGATIEIEIRVTNKTLGPPKDLLKGLECGPFILISQIVFGRFVPIFWK